MFFSTYLSYKQNNSNNIKTIKSRSFSYRFCKEKKEHILKESPGNYDLFFDSEGRLVESHHYKSKKIIAKYFYDSNEFDNDLYLIDESIEGNEYADTITEFFYDIKNRITLEKISIIQSEIEIQLTTLYYQNKKIEFFDNVNDENYRGHTVYEYENGKILQIDVFTDQNQKISCEKFSHNREQNSVTTLSPIGEDSTEVFGEDGLLTDYIFYSNGVKIHRKLTYEKNVKGDWIKQFVTENSVKKSVTEREIEYF